MSLIAHGCSWSDALSRVGMAYRALITADLFIFLKIYFCQQTGWKALEFREKPKHHRIHC